MSAKDNWPVRYCQNPACGKQLVPKSYEERHQFLDRKTCGRTCGALVGNARRERSVSATVTANGTCNNIECGKPLMPHRGEDKAHFLKRKYCDQACARKRFAGRRPSVKRCPCDTCGSILPLSRVSGGYTTCVRCNANWPKVTAEDTADFAAHNLVFLPQVTRLPGQEPRVSLQGCGTAMAAAERTAI